MDSKRQLHVPVSFVSGDPEVVVIACAPFDLPRTPLRVTMRLTEFGTLYTQQ
jgi:hypothetical protein